MKFFSFVSALFVTLTWVAVAQAQACSVSLQCGQALQLQWSSQGTVDDCVVTSPNGNPVGSGDPTGNACNSPWVPVNAESGQYTFTAVSSAGTPLSSSCQINMPTGCGAGGFSVSASPNPVQVCAPATQGPTTVSWSIPSGKTGGVRVSNNSNWFVPAGTSISGSQSAPWITTSGSPFVFTLFETTGGMMTERASVSVSATTAGCPGNGGAVCGNGTVESPEQCDAGQQNGQSGSGCTSQCTLVNTGGTGFCGDGTVQNPNGSGQYEQCDLGSTNGQPGSTCTSVCTNAGSGIAYNKCTASNMCVVAGTYPTFEACNLANGNTCVTSCATCTTTPPGQRFYRCSAGACVQTQEYFDIQSCNAAGQGTCYYYSDCNNQCSQNSTYTITATPVNICTPNTQGDTTISWNNPQGQPVDIYREGQRILQGQPSSGTTSQTISGSTTFSMRLQGQTTNLASVTVTPTSNNCSPLGNSCVFSASPSSVPVGQTVSLSLSAPGATSCLYSTTNGASPTISGIPSGVSSAPLVSGTNTFRASCEFATGGRGETVTCTPATATGTTGPVSETRWTCAGGPSCIQTTCDPNNVACMNATFPTQEACASASPACSVSGGGTLGARCENVLVPSRVLAGQSFTVSPVFVNNGGVVWTSQFSARSSSAVSSWNMTRPVLGTVAFPAGQFIPSFNLTAPAQAGTYALSFQMQNASGVTFGSQCTVSMNGQPGVQVLQPECSDGVDNNDPEDTLADENDPACIRNGVYDPTWDDERDPSPNAALRISANPQLVRQGGRSTVEYEVNNCTVLDGEGNRVPGAWEVRVNGNLVQGHSGVGTSNGVRQIFVTDIQTRLTYTLSCGGTSRSATISVIRINEI